MEGWQETDHGDEYMKPELAADGSVAKKESINMSELQDPRHHELGTALPHEMETPRQIVELEAEEPQPQELPVNKRTPSSRLTPANNRNPMTPSAD